MKEDVLEQIVDDYLQTQGYFTRHNIKYRPHPEHPDYDAAQDRVRSDIDVIGINPKLRGREKVIVVSCKAYQEGFRPRYWLYLLKNNKKKGNGPAWKRLRELWVPKWAESFRSKVEELTGDGAFTYKLAVTHLTGNQTTKEAASEWMSEPTIAENLAGSDFGFLTLEEMWKQVLSSAELTPASSEIGRLAQLLKASGLAPLDPPTFK